MATSSQVTDITALTNAPDSNFLRRAFARMRRNWFVYLFLIPTFTLLIVFSFYPAALAFIMSLFDWIPGVSQKFVGLKNFERVLTDPFFHTSWRNILIIAVWSFSIPFMMPIIVAELIFNLKSGFAKQMYRVLILVPILIPSMVTMQLWKWMYAFPNGGINSILKALGLTSLMTPWLGNADTALPALLFMGFPWMIGIAPLIYLAGLMNISQDMLDAAHIDGATLVQRIRFIDMPLIIGQIRLFFVFGVIGVFQEFGNQLVLTQGGPSGATMVPGLYLYMKAFGIDRLSQNLKSMGEASVVGVILFTFIVLATIAGNRLIRTAEEKGA